MDRIVDRARRDQQQKSRLIVTTKGETGELVLRGIAWGLASAGVVTLYALSWLPYLAP